MRIISVTRAPGTKGSASIPTGHTSPETTAKYCCTYVGSYDKIIEDNEHDTGRTRGKDLDEYGVPRTPSGGQERNGNDRNGGITR